MKKTNEKIMPERIRSFAPIVDQHSKILILGSVPGIKSLEAKQYYAHPQNKFWNIIFEIFEQDFTTDYLQRIKILQKNKIALWDVIDSCERNGSLDSEIRNEEANQIADLLERHPNIQAIFCNGQKSYKNLQKILGKNFKLPIHVLPSTSPAYAGMRYNQKLAVWRKINEIL